MICVEKQHEPKNFEIDVRKKGLKWIQKHQLLENGAPPVGTKFPTYWTSITEPLYNKYGGICAYYAHFIHLLDAEIDHFIPKSKEIALVYEWDNYRLACSKANKYKADKISILDPFLLELETFYLNLITGEIIVNLKANFSAKYIALAKSRIFPEFFQFRKTFNTKSR